MVKKIQGQVVHLLVLCSYKLNQCLGFTAEKITTVNSVIPQIFMMLYAHLIEHFEQP